jgi:hypothetical protein
VNNPTLHANSIPLPAAPVDALAIATKRLWLQCVRKDMPLERADALIREPAALDLAAARILTKYPDLNQPRRLVNARGYFVARVVSLHRRSVVLLLPDTETLTVSRGHYVRNDITATVDFHSTYPRAHTGHFMFRRMDNGKTIRRVCAISGAKSLC